MYLFNVSDEFSFFFVESQNNDMCRSDIQSGSKCPALEACNISLDAVNCVIDQIVHQEDVFLESINEIPNLEKFCEEIYCQNQESKRKKAQTKQKKSSRKKQKLQYRFDDKSKEYENKLHEDDDDDDENTYDDCDDGDDGDDENTYGDCDDGDDENTYDDGDDEDDYKPDYCSNSEDSDSDRSIIVPHIQKHAVVKKEDTTIKKDISNEEFFFKKNESTIYDQVHACVFCGKLLSNISKHLKKVHGNEEKVKDILLLREESSCDRKLIQAKWDLLRNEGDHTHNCKVMKEGKGQFIVARRNIKEDFKISDYGPCPHCFLWMKLKVTMSRHQKVCAAFRTNKDTYFQKSKGELRIQSLALSERISASKQLREEVLPIMTNDITSEIAQNDFLIVALGSHWLSRNVGNVLKRKYYTSSRMREAARLLMNARDCISGQQDVSMSEILQPMHFDTVVKAALMTASAGFDDEEDLKSPSTAIRLGYDIKKMLNCKWAKGIKEKDKEKIDDCKHFLRLMNLEWSTRVTKLATVTLEFRHFNKEKSLPDPDDIIHLQKHIKDELSNLKLSVATSDLETFRNVSRLSQARLLIFNKRRSGEIESMR